ncbi:MAG: NADH-quinone oxidoreductase subunit L [Deltaproteobacteria bacterium]|nr:NADH-quinone oxidoreductase subunit L [Deltaproteobacteria bacterium]
MPEYSGQVTHVELALVPLWLIVLLPFLGAAANAGAGWWLQKRGFGRALAKRLHVGPLPVSAIGVGVMALAFCLALCDVVQLASLEHGHRYLYSHAWQMVRIGSLDASFSFAMDPLGAVMTLVVTGVGALIHVYATAYMADDPGYWRFFAEFNLFIFAMLLLVLGDNFIVMFFGWEGVGLCSYLLIGFWHRDYAKASAGMKAFVVNRIGDWGFVCGIALLFWGLGGIWLAGSGEFLPDFGERFIAVHAEPATAEEHQAPGHGAGAGAGHRGPEAGRGPDLRSLSAAAHETGTLTMTSYAGARVYLGVMSVEQLRSQGLPDCRSLPAWSGGSSGPALTPECYAVSPFLRKSVPAGVHRLVVVPGAGATVAGDGAEMASIRVRIQPGEEVVVAPVGPTLTFREIQDQLVVQDGAGRFLVRDALQDKTVWGIMLVTLACLCFFVGATGKSAQIPLYVWLPDAMAGPTPVSALIHAATMVTAGVYMVARLGFLFSLTEVGSGAVALVGALTALAAAGIGFFQYDIKKVLAYSTVSQLGFMFIGVGVGAYWAGIFHLTTHAFFKACLFLGSGSVIHGMHAVVHDEAGAQDMRNMGGLGKQMRLTARTYYVACLAITAAPIPLLAGFWSKDEILWKAFNAAGTGPVLGGFIYAFGLVAALGTSFYMWRSYYLTFTGQPATQDIPDKVHDSPPAMTWVLAVLAFFSAVAGALLGFSRHFVGGHGEPLLEEWLHPSFVLAPGRFGHGSLGDEYALMALSVAGAIGSWFLARRRYGFRRPADWQRREQLLPFFRLLHHKYFLDEIYAATIVRGFLALRLLFASIDKWIVDGLVNAAAMAGRAAAWAVGAFDNHGVDGMVNAVAGGTLGAGNRIRRVQTGRIQSYVYGILGGIAVIAIVRYLLW